MITALLLTGQHQTNICSWRKVSKDWTTIQKSWRPGLCPALLSFHPRTVLRVKVGAMDACRGVVGRRDWKGRIAGKVWGNWMLSSQDVIAEV